MSVSTNPSSTPGINWSVFNFVEFPEAISEIDEVPLARAAVSIPGPSSAKVGEVRLEQLSDGRRVKVPYLFESPDKPFVFPDGEMVTFSEDSTFRFDKVQDWVRIKEKKHDGTILEYFVNTNPLSNHLISKRDKEVLIVHSYRPEKTFPTDQTVEAHIAHLRTTFATDEIALFTFYNIHGICTLSSNNIFYWNKTGPKMRIFSDKFTNELDKEGLLSIRSNDHQVAYIHGEQRFINGTPARLQIATSGLVKKMLAAIPYYAYIPVEAQQLKYLATIAKIPSDPTPPPTEFQHSPSPTSINVAQPLQTSSQISSSASLPSPAPLQPLPPPPATPLQPLPPSAPLQPLQPPLPAQAVGALPPISKSKKPCHKSYRPGGSITVESYVEHYKIRPEIRYLGLNDKKNPHYGLFMNGNRVNLRATNAFNGSTKITIEPWIGFGFRLQEYDGNGTEVWSVSEGGVANFIDGLKSEMPLLDSTTFLLGTESKKASCHRRHTPGGDVIVESYVEHYFTRPEIRYLGLEKVTEAFNIVVDTPTYGLFIGNSQLALGDRSQCFYGSTKIIIEVWENLGFRIQESTGDVTEIWQVENGKAVYIGTNKEQPLFESTQKLLAFEKKLGYEFS